MRTIKITRYTLKAKPERTVIKLPVRGSKTLVKDLLKVVKQESIPANAAVNIMYNTDGTSRGVRFEFVTPTTDAVAA